MMIINVSIISASSHYCRHALELDALPMEFNYVLDSYTSGGSGTPDPMPNDPSEEASVLFF